MFPFFYVLTEIDYQPSFILTVVAVVINGHRDSELYSITFVFASEVEHEELTINNLSINMNDLIGDLFCSMCT